MFSFITELIEGFGNIVTVVFFFLCVFIAHLVLSKPVIKNFLTQGGTLPFFVSVLITGSWLYASFAFLISDAFYFLQQLSQSSFGISDVFKFLQDVVVIGVLGVGSYLIYHSHQKGPAKSSGSSAILGLTLTFCFLILTACSSRYGDPWVQARDFLRTANLIIFSLLYAIAYLVAGLAAYRVAKTSIVELPLRELSPVHHLLVFCVLTNLLFGAISYPVYYFYNFIERIANQSGFVLISSSFLSAVLFVVGLILAFSIISGTGNRHGVSPVTKEPTPSE